MAFKTSDAGGASNLAMQSPNGFSFGGGGVIMNIESCREFIELAQCLNFTEAAGNLNITQPALSKHMLALEKEFGIELLDRGKKGVQLTEGGRILFESAGVIVNEYDKTRNTLEQLKAKRPIHVVGHMEDSDIASLASMTAMIARENHHANIVFDRNIDDPLHVAIERVHRFVHRIHQPPSRRTRGIDQ